MTIDIERIAREAGAFQIGITPAFITGEPINTWSMTTEDLRRLAAMVLEKAAKVCERRRETILSKQSGKDGDPVDTNLRMVAWMGAHGCAEELRTIAASLGGMDGG